MKFDNIGFIGLGLIGGSIARKIKINNPDARIIATAGHESTITQAYEIGLIENNMILPLDEFDSCDVFCAHQSQKI